MSLADLRNAFDLCPSARASASARSPLILARAVALLSSPPADAAPFTFRESDRAESVNCDTFNSPSPCPVASGPLQPHLTHSTLTSARDLRARRTWCAHGDLHQVDFLTFQCADFVPVLLQHLSSHCRVYARNRFVSYTRTHLPSADDNDTKRTINPESSDERIVP